MEDPKPTPKTRFSALYPLQNGPSGLKIWENTPRGPFSMPPPSILNKKKFCEKSRGWTGFGGSAVGRTIAATVPGGPKTARTKFFGFGQKWHKSSRPE